MDRRFSCRNREAALLDIIAAVLEVLIQPGEPFNKRLGELVQELAFESKFDFRAVSFEQSRTQVPLQRLHLQRYGWLRETQPVRRLRDASRFNDGAKSLQLLQSI